MNYITSFSLIVHKTANHEVPKTICIPCYMPRQGLKHIGSRPLLQADSVDVPSNTSEEITGLWAKYTRRFDGKGVTKFI